VACFTTANQQNDLKCFASTGVKASAELFFRLTEFRYQPTEVGLDRFLQLLARLSVVISEVRELISHLLFEAGELLLHDVAELLVRLKWCCSRVDRFLCERPGFL
jgi:hypothetical protein